MEAIDCSNERNSHVIVQGGDDFAVEQCSQTAGDGTAQYHRRNNQSRMRHCKRNGIFTDTEYTENKVGDRVVAASLVEIALVQQHGDQQGAHRNGQGDVHK